MPYEYKKLDDSIGYLFKELNRLDKGSPEPIDFVTRDEVTKFCKLLKFADTWAGKKIDQITEESDYGPRIVKATEAAKLLEVLRAEIAKDSGPFKTVNPTILNDFLPKKLKTFKGEPTLNHFWEFQYALAVELEHGRTNGTNVTNNHPLLTGVIAMAHLTEDTLYYARLWVMETEAELCNLILKSPTKYTEIGKLTLELNRAKLYLSKRELEKAKDIDIPE